MNVVSIGYMFERRTYTLDAKDFKRIVDFILHFQQRFSVADKDEEGSASQLKEFSAVNTINRWSVRGCLVVEECQ